MVSNENLLVMAASLIAWVGLFTYLWILSQRVKRLERRDGKS